MYDRRLRITALILLIAILLTAGCRRQKPEETTAATEAEAETQTDAVSDAATDAAPTAAQTASAAPASTTQAPSTAPAVPAATAPAVPATAANAAETTTAAPTGVTPVTEAARPMPGPGNDYEIMRAGTFYYAGTMTSDGTGYDMEIALSPDVTCALMDYEGIRLGFMVKGGKNYMLYPPKNFYIELNKAALSMLKLDGEDLFGDMQISGEDMEPISNAASVEDAVFNGTPCTLYTFISATGAVSRVYMNGDRMIGLETVDNTGKLTSSTVIRSFSGEIPANMRDLSGYKKGTVLNLFSLIKDMAGQ
ncbi:MAG: hypothetical protein IJK40_01395 [Clostridia bacterium]|nr:hypothetical protein [Clostridia bacterium]